VFGDVKKRKKALLVELHGVDVLQKKDLFCVRKRQERLRLQVLERTTVMGVCLGLGDWFGEGQSRRIGLPELTYGDGDGDGDEGIMGYSRYPCLLTTLRAVFDKIQHAFLYSESLLIEYNVTAALASALFLGILSLFISLKSYYQSLN